MTPNQITALRVGIAFAAVALFGHNTWVNLTALGLIVLAIVLDAVDGYVARWKNLATALGAQFDILGDRVIENLFFTFFAACGLVSVWVPVMFFVRGTLTDFIRALAARAGKAGFGKNSMLESWWGRKLVASRASRAAYGALKCACFCYLGLQLTFARSSAAAALGEQGMNAVAMGSQVLVSATVVFCLVRGLPVLWEGRRYLTDLGDARVGLPALSGAEGRLPRRSRGALTAATSARGAATPRSFGVPATVAKP